MDARALESTARETANYSRELVMQHCRVQIVASVSVAIILAFTGGANAQVIAAAGFNDVSGINGDGVSNNLPYNVNNGELGVPGQGSGEPGWGPTWFAAGPFHVVNSGQSEGDGAAFISGTITAFASRQLVQFPTQTKISVKLKMGSFPVSQVGFQADTFRAQGSPQATNWQVQSDGHFWVTDGHGDSTGTLLDTGFVCTPGTYQAIDVLLNTSTETWDFFVDGIRFNGPHPLGFLNHLGIFHLDSVRFVYGSAFGGVDVPGGVFFDALTISQVPEPSSFVSMSIVLCLSAIRVVRIRTW